MKNLLPFLFLSLVIFSCKESEGPESCGVENPAQNLPWLAERIEEIEASSFSEYFYVTEARYKGNTVFLMENCCPFCSSVVTVFNCSGENIGYLSEQNGIDPAEITQVRIAWKPSNSSCNFTS
ncbi:MAG: hypothetical protein LPK25_11925 [Cyclobacteriaceae bacterium]|nr:hypothetical protein [Cyclobacteriaceae bacterium]MDX5467273.1 hypothetical protein [Cyclobacteriaceae bacterium]